SSITRYVASPAGTVISVNHDLTPWLEDPQNFDAKTELDPMPQHWLVYLASVDAAHSYAELSERAVAMFRLLSSPITVGELAVALGGLSTAEIVQTLNALIEIGVVIRD